MPKSVCNISNGDIEIRLSGSGGQGLISAGVLLGEAIGIGDGKNVVQAQSYGPEARGGATRCDVLISNSEIYYPECTSYDILLCLTQMAYDKYNKYIKPNGTIIIDSEIEALGGKKTVSVPFIGSARDKLGAVIVANIIALGFISEYSGIVSKKSIKASVAKRFDGTKHLNLNIEAIDVGMKLAKEIKKKEEK